MGYDEGKLTVMRVKQIELRKVRYERDKAEAAQQGLSEFTFDGMVYPTGLDKEAIKKDEEKLKKANQ